MARVRPCVFFDRDGIANQSPGPGYVEDPDRFFILPSFLEAVKWAEARGYARVLVTNQRGIALGKVLPENLAIMHERLQFALRRHGTSLDDILVCPHENGTCTCRKPQPGMLLQAAEKHVLDLEHSWMVGDHGTDVQAGQAAGCRAILVAEHPVPGVQPDVWMKDMQACAAWMRDQLPAHTSN